MKDPDEIKAELEAEERRLEELIQRSVEQGRDIKKFDNRLEALTEDIAEAEAEAIPSEQIET